MSSLPLAVVLNVALVIFVAWAIIWLVTREPPKSEGCAQ